MTLTRAESWAWRMLMPALLFGGVAASWVIVVVALLRVTSWWWNHRSKSWSWNWGSAGWLLFFGLQVAGGMWSENVEAWRFSLEVKSSMWALPVLAAMPGRSMIRDFWWSVGWSVSAYLLWRLARAGWHHVVLDDARQWHYARFAGDVHPTYLSLHAAVAWVGCGRQWGKPNAWMWGCTVLVAIALGLIASKAGIIAAAAVALIGMALPRLWGRADRFAMGHGAAFLVLLVGVSWGASKKRFEEMGTAAAAVRSESAPVQSSSAGRVAAWRASAELLAANPFGVGTGDVTDALVELYGRDGVTYASERRLNPHNQWLQAGVAFGWPGMLLWTAVLLWWGWYGWRQRSRWGVLCVLLIGAHTMVESMLEVQRGVVFILWLFAAAVAPPHDPELNGSKPD